MFGFCHLDDVDDDDDGEYGDESTSVCTFVLLHSIHTHLTPSILSSSMTVFFSLSFLMGFNE
jgi:hypothetical protein